MNLDPYVHPARELHSHYTVLPISGTFTYSTAQKDLVVYSTTQKYLLIQITDYTLEQKG